MTNRKMKYVVLISIVFIIALSFTYAYFSSILSPYTPNNILTETGTLKLTYNAGREVSIKDAFPGDKLIKTFSVQNTGSLEAVYTIYLADIINNIERNELVLYGTCESSTGECEDIVTQNIAASGTQTINGNISIDVDEIHTYTITILFREMSSHQNYNQGKNFSGKILINEYKFSESALPVIENANISLGELTASITDLSGIVAYSIKDASSTTPEPWTQLPSSKKSLNLQTGVDDYDKKIWVKNIEGNVIYEDLTPLPQLLVIPNGGTWEESTGNQTFNLKYKAEKEISDPQRDGYTFTGWNITGTESTLVNRIFKMGVSDSTLTAQWTANTFTLEINPNGGQHDGYNTTQDYSMSPNATKTINNPTRTGYTFTGWTKSNELACNLSTTLFTMGNSNCTLTATWDVNDYPWIVYHNKQNVNGNGYTLVSADTGSGTASYGTNITPLTNSYTGFTSPNSQIINIVEDTNPPVNNVVNYNYSRNKYKLTIDPNGGTYNGSTSPTVINNVYYQSTTNISTVSRTGYNFNNWSMSGTGGTLSDNVLTMGTSNTTLSANYNAISMTVYFNKNGGGTLSELSRTVYYDSEYGVLPTASRSGYGFLGWYTSPVDGVKVENNTIVSELASHTLYAHWQSPTITEKILADNTERSDSSINFAAISSASNGLGLYYNTDSSNGATIYYYRGAVTNNYLVFANFCWRIVRTNEDGSVKLRYNGPLVGGICSQTGTNVNVGVTDFYSQDNDNSYSFLVNAGGTSYNYQHATSNAYFSDVQTTINNWYNTNIRAYTKYSSMIADTPYCNDRSIHSASSLYGITNTKKGYGTYSTIYNGFGKVISNYLNGTTLTPSFVCPQASDNFTWTSTSGNRGLQYPIALLTLDEAIYAGNVYNVQNPTNYLTTGKSYWLMTPAYYNNGATVMALDITGAIYEDLTTTLWGTIWWDETQPEPNEDAVAVPVISLVSTATINGGSGSYSDPYLVY